MLDEPLAQHRRDLHGLQNDGHPRQVTAARHADLSRTSAGLSRTSGRPVKDQRPACQRPTAGLSKSNARIIGRVIDHLSIQCADVTASARFYDAVLGTLGGTRIMDFGEVIGYGFGRKPSFWLGPLAKGEGEPNREIHVAFVAETRAAVRAFFDVAVGQGAEVLHQPRLWPEYHATYYGGFVRDPDGNNVEAVCHTPE